MHKLLLPVAILLTLSACRSEKADLRRLQALTYSLERANERAARDNAVLWRTIQSEVAGERFGQLVPNSAVAQLVAHTDTIQVAAKHWRAQLLKCRKQLNALTVDSAATTLSLGMYKETSQLLRQMATYRATLLAQDSQLVLPQLLPPRTAADTTAAAMASFYFRGATPAEALASLAQLEATVLADEAAALLGQSMRLACGGNIIYDSTHPQALADTTAVVAGTEYHASLFLAAVLKPAGMSMSANGQPILVRPSGFGRVRFVADPRLLGNKQEVMAHWDGLIRVKSAYTQSGDTTYQVRVPYRIVRGR